jgi:hypothetical protein
MVWNTAIGQLANMARRSSTTMKHETVRATAFAMPLTNTAFPSAQPTHEIPVIDGSAKGSARHHIHAESRNEPACSSGLQGPESVEEISHRFARATP